MVDAASEVYDLIYPSPIPLEDVSSIVVAIELWRSNLKKHRTYYTSEDVCSSNFNSYQISHLPWVIKTKIEFYFNKLVSSMMDWLRFHFEYVFKFHRDSAGDILNDFNEIICDYDGCIHYVRTAKRMLCCDRICQYEKFLIACIYCFEDQIREIWPSIENGFDEWITHTGVSDMDTDHIIQPDFCNYPHLYYWIHRLRNTMDQIPNRGGVPDDLMLLNTKTECRSSFEYFWNRVSFESQNHTVARLYKCTSSELKFCARFLLLKLNEQQLNDFVIMEGANLMNQMLMTCNENYVLQVWMHIGRRMDETNFIRLINELLSENNCRLNDENSVTCCKIWKSAADNLKQSAIKTVLLDQSLYQKFSEDPSQPREVRFLMQVLNDVTLEQRGIFWRNNWPSLFASTRPVDLQQIMLACFSNETEIDEFKKNTMAKYENLIEIAKTFFWEGYFAEWSNRLQFCCPDKQTNRHLKRRLLQYSYLGRGSVVSSSIKNPKPLHEFIDDAFSDDFELASDFRYQLLSSVYTMNVLLDYLIISSKYVKKFVESFALSDLKLKQWKELFIEFLRNFEIRLKGNPRLIETRAIQDFVLWCLGSYDEVNRFKQSIDMDYSTP